MGAIASAIRSLYLVIESLAVRVAVYFLLVVEHLKAEVTKQYRGTVILWNHLDLNNANC